jgi:hypothetical protein
MLIARLIAVSVFPDALEGLVIATVLQPFSSRLLIIRVQRRLYTE